MIELRDIILSYLQTNVSGYNVSDKLPFVKQDDPLYLKNAKTIYVDLPDSNQETTIVTLDGKYFVNETITVPIYVAVDAKTLPEGFSALHNTIGTARYAGNTLGATQRETNVDSEYEGDLLVTRFEVTFTRVC